MSTPKRSPRLTANHLTFATLLIGAVVSAVSANIRIASILLGIAVVGYGFVWLSRRFGQTELSRIHALEYSDERDRAIATKGYAIVGVVAIVVTVIEYVLVQGGISLPVREGWDLSSIKLFVFMVVWMLANAYGARTT